MIKKANNTHGLFWSLLKQIPGYSEENKESFKALFVEEYTNAATDSLPEMYNKYPAEYSEMIQALKKLAPKKEYDAERNTLNKRLLRVMCLWVDAKGYKFDSDADKLKYVKSIACRKASCKYFNKIPKSLLNDFYHSYCRMIRADLTTVPDADYKISPN